MLVQVLEVVVVYNKGGTVCCTVFLSFSLVFTVPPLRKFPSLRTTSSRRLSLGDEATSRVASRTTSRDLEGGGGHGRINQEPCENIVKKDLQRWWPLIRVLINKCFDFRIILGRLQVLCSDPKLLTTRSTSSYRQML